ncbi:MAG: ATP-dependent DNA helicase [Thermoplasmata archaeon]|nr:ATP-dependent DNA helicase [Thermoplasmata archaeon]
MNLFPYKPRRNQEKIVRVIEDALRDGKHLILEAPAGSGKTICSLAAALSFAKENGMGIVYLTRTNSQQKQAIKELKEMNVEGIRAVSIQGRANMCLLMEEIPSLQEKYAGNEEVARLCRARKKKSMEALRGEKVENRCPFFENFILTRDDLKFDRVVAAEELMEYGRKYRICAYEVNKMLARKADIIIAPYIYIFDEFLRESFISNFGYALENSILIVDEAHNLPDFCRELLSFSLSLNTVKGALKEVEDYGINDSQLLHLMEALERILERMKNDIQFSETSDALLPENKLTEEMKREGVDVAKLKDMGERMVTYGDIIADIKESRNMIPRSFVRSVGNFLLRWIEMNEKWVKIVEKNEDSIKIEGYCLDASLASSIINSFYASIHMSGTLQPMDEYRDSMGIDASMATFPSPFPEKNRKIIYVNGVSTRYYMDDAMVEKIVRGLEKIFSTIERNTLVLFPSYSVLGRFLEKINVKRGLYMEERGERQESIMGKLSEFKEKGGIFLSVMGGRLAEGIDFPSEELEMVIIVGIPYPPPSAKQGALQAYYDAKYGDGWKYVMEASAIRKMMQAIGRLIRSENDRGVAIIFDERAKRFRKYMKMEQAGNAEEAAEMARRFFSRSG